MYEELGINIDKLNEDIDSVLEELRVLRADKRLERIIGDDIAAIKACEQAIKQRRSEPFNIMIAGDFKRGKSTLVNALLGEYAAQVNVLPETMTINKLSYGEEPSCRAVLKNGREVSIELGASSRSRLEKLALELPSEIDHLDIRLNNEILKDIHIIDTPGLGDLFEIYDLRVSEYLNKADAIIYVSSALFPLSDTERAYLSSTIMPQGFSRMFLVVNMADILSSEEDIRRVEDMSKERMLAINPEASVFILSALDEYNRRLGLPRPKQPLEAALEGRFGHFIAALQNDIIMQRGVIKPARIALVARNMLNNIGGKLAMYGKMLRMKTADIKEMESKLASENSGISEAVAKEERTLSADIFDMGEETKRWMTEFIQRLKKDISGAKISAESMHKHLQFYLTDSIKSALTACLEAHRERIGGRLRDSARALFAGVLNDMPLTSVGSEITGSISDMGWTKVDSFVFASDFISAGIGMSMNPLVILGQGIAGAFRKREQDKSDLVSPVLAQFGNISSAVTDEITKIYAKIGQDASASLKDACAKQYEQLLQTAAQTAAYLADESADIEEVIGYLSGVEETVNSLKGIVEVYI